MNKGLFVEPFGNPKQVQKETINMNLKEEVRWTELALHYVCIYRVQLWTSLVSSANYFFGKLTRTRDQLSGGNGDIQ
jgi:hypothetical protein